MIIFGFFLKVCVLKTVCRSTRKLSTTQVGIHAISMGISIKLSINTNMFLLGRMVISIDGRLLLRQRKRTLHHRFTISSSVQLVIWIKLVRDIRQENRKKPICLLAKWSAIKRTERNSIKKYFQALRARLAWIGLPSPTLSCLQRLNEMFRQAMLPNLFWIRLTITENA